jgi:predicted ArsR family transcriptional regulator
LGSLLFTTDDARLGWSMRDRRGALSAVAILADDVRRALFEYVRRAGRPVTRELAAETVGISRKLAAFHLDKLVRAGLLTATTSGSSSTGVGRRPKAYEAAPVDVRVVIPERRADALAEILLEGVLRPSGGENPVEAILRVATECGARLGQQQRRSGKPGRLGAERALTLSEPLLEQYGYEPVREGPTRMRLRNCPFQPLADREPELVCAINHALLTGYLHGLEASTVRVQSDAESGWCCVQLVGG